MADVKVFGGKGAEHHSDVEGFSVVSAGVANMQIENLLVRKSTCTPGEVFDTPNYLASYKIRNTGTGADRCYIRHLVWTGSAWKDIEGSVLETITEIPPNGTSGGILPTNVTWTCPSAGVRTYFAIKVWGKTTESEPANPAAPT